MAVGWELAAARLTFRSYTEYPHPRDKIDGKILQHEVLMTEVPIQWLKINARWKIRNPVWRQNSSQQVYRSKFGGSIAISPATE